MKMMSWLTMWIIVATAGVTFYIMSSQSHHRFDPRQDKPNECRLCGRRRDAHPS
jgi:hypothetical protein